MQSSWLYMPMGSIAESFGLRLEILGNVLGQRGRIQFCVWPKMPMAFVFGWLEAKRDLSAVGTEVVGFGRTGQFFGQQGRVCHFYTHDVKYNVGARAMSRASGLGGTRGRYSPNARPASAS